MGHYYKEYSSINGFKAINSNLQSKYAITVGRQADASASAGFTGYQVVSSDASGNGSVKHGYAGFTLKYQWELSENGGIYIKVSGSGGYGTVSADFTLAPL